MTLPDARGFSARLQEAYQDHSDRARWTGLTKNAVVDHRRETIVEQYSIQRLIRPLFGKGEPASPAIGTPADFVHLAGTSDVELAPITTLFMDLEGSTRLGLFYPLEEVFHIKNTMISAAIEIVNAFDGHVHRIMGDAVMAFFGEKAGKPEDGIINALNCAAVLQYFVENAVRPKLGGDDLNAPFGVRIGVDFGRREEVLWSAYGYPGVEEVTATSFHVDGASKLQHAAPRNGVMLGASLVEAMDFPDELLAVRQVQKGGSATDEPFLRPNYTGPDGKPINYRQHLFRWEEYLQLTALGQGSVGEGRAPLLVEAGTAPSEEFLTQGTYFPASMIIEKGSWLEFRVRADFQPSPGSQLVFKVENHGAECKVAVDEGHTSQYSVDSASAISAVRHRRSTAYRGLHFMAVRVAREGATHHEVRFGVYVR